MTLGKAVRSEWQLDPDFLTVNHGSFGATPIAVRAEQDGWRARMEAQPTRFMSGLPALLRDAADQLGAFLGGEGRNIAFLDNATTGCNAVLRSLVFAPGDDVLVLNHGYGAVRNTVRFVTERAGATMTEAAIPFPGTDEYAVVEAIASALTGRTRLAVIDHITSASGLVLPLARIVAACHADGVPVLVDGAHAPGQIDLDLARLGADWYAGNCHKWLCAPKGGAFLWANPERQAGLHPTVISHGLGQGFLTEFDWTGTRDPSAALSVPAALAFHARLGGPALRVRNITLAAEASALVARRLNTETGVTGPMSGAMGLVRLPYNGPPLALRARLLAAGTDAPVHAIAGAIWLRLSAFAYNELEDYDHLADLVARVIREA